jgi:hypothetical protein
VLGPQSSISGLFSGLSGSEAPGPWVLPPDKNVEGRVGGDIHVGLGEGLAAGKTASHGGRRRALAVMRQECLNAFSARRFCLNRVTALELPGAAEAYLSLIRGPRRTFSENRLSLP